jgi:sulfur-oxidizing protein SoxY
MQLTRRETLALGVGAAAMVAIGVPGGDAHATTEAADQLIKEFTGGKTPEMGKVSLNAPEIAENGNTVPIGISVDSPMTEASYVAAVMLVTNGNPTPGVATFHFTPMSGSAAATTRIRLAKTQDVIAVARMNDGSVFMDQKQVKVTIGGCGG